MVLLLECKVTVRKKKLMSFKFREVTYKTSVKLYLIHTQKEKQFVFHNMVLNVYSGLPRAKPNEMHSLWRTSSKTTTENIETIRLILVTMIIQLANSDMKSL